jgi:hypothetical protein
LGRLFWPLLILSGPGTALLLAFKQPDASLGEASLGEANLGEEFKPLRFAARAS